MIWRPCLCAVSRVLYRVWCLADGKGRLPVFLMAGLFSALCAAAGPRDIWRGVDLSYVNELEDCGVEYRSNGEGVDVYRLFADQGANLVRLRLWHTPTWTRYSTLEDVSKSIRRAKENGMRVLLDFHYSDDWADPKKQVIPDAWRDAEGTQALADRLRDYTRVTLETLDSQGLTPDSVQIGNEINGEMLMPEPIEEGTPINWKRNVMFLNAGLQAVQAFNVAHQETVQTMLHIAQPENVEAWLNDAAAAGLLDFDLLGLSYYTKWSKVPHTLLGYAIRRLRQKYGKDVVIVETAYPWTLKQEDSAHNILGQDSLAEAYPATQDGQRSFLIDMMKTVVSNGGLGVVYWEPAWVSSQCRTRWGQGSHWENASLFTYGEKELHQGADFLGYDYRESLSGDGPPGPWNERP